MINKLIYLILLCSFLVGQDSIMVRYYSLPRSNDASVIPIRNSPDYRRDIYRVDPNQSFQIWMSSERGFPLRIDEKGDYYIKIHPNDSANKFKFVAYIKDELTDQLITWSSFPVPQMKIYNIEEDIRNINPQSYTVNGLGFSMYDASRNTFKDGQKITATWHFDHNSLKICDPSQDIAKSVRVYVEGYTSKKFTMFLTVESNPNPRDDYKMKNPFFRAYHAIELFQKGYTYAEKKEYDSAIAYYLKAIELDPNIGYQPYANLGQIYLEQDNYTEAIQNYEKTIELKPDYGEAYANLGIAHRQNGDLETGLIYYKKAARLGAKEIQSWLKENGYKW